MDQAGHPGKSAAQVKEAPVNFAELTWDWKSEAVLSTVGGMFIGGYAGKFASTSKFARHSEDALNIGLGSAIEKRLGYRLSRAGRGSINGGVVVGTCLAVYCGAYNWFAKKRGVQDVYTWAVAGSALSCTMIMMEALRDRAAKVPRSAILPLVGMVVRRTPLFTPMGWYYQKRLEEIEKRQVR